MNWIAGLVRAIDYIENNLDEKLDYEEIAKQAYSSSYHFMRVFSILCGHTLGDYIRQRRLTLAGTELTNTKVVSTNLCKQKTITKIKVYFWSKHPIAREPTTNWEQALSIFLIGR